MAASAPVLRDDWVETPPPSIGPPLKLPPNSLTDSLRAMFLKLSVALEASAPVHFGGIERLADDTRHPPRESTPEGLRSPATTLDQGRRPFSPMVNVHAVLHLVRWMDAPIGWPDLLMRLRAQCGDSIALNEAGFIAIMRDVFLATSASLLHERYGTSAATGSGGRSTHAPSSFIRHHVDGNTNDETFTVVRAAPSPPRRRPAACGPLSRPRQYHQQNGDGNGGEVEPPQEEIMTVHIESPATAPGSGTDGASSLAFGTHVLARHVADQADSGEFAHLLAITRASPFLSFVNSTPVIDALLAYSTPLSQLYAAFRRLLTWKRRLLRKHDAFLLHATSKRDVCGASEFGQDEHGPEWAAIVFGLLSHLLSEGTVSGTYQQSKAFRELWLLLSSFQGVLSTIAYCPSGIGPQRHDTDNKQAAFINFRTFLDILVTFATTRWVLPVAQGEASRLDVTGCTPAALRSAVLQLMQRLFGDPLTNGAVSSSNHLGGSTVHPAISTSEQRCMTEWAATLPQEEENACEQSVQRLMIETACRNFLQAPSTHVTEVSRNSVAASAFDESSLAFVIERAALSDAQLTIGLQVHSGLGAEALVTFLDNGAVHGASRRQRLSALVASWLVHNIERDLPIVSPVNPVLSLAVVASRAQALARRHSTFNTPRRAGSPRTPTSSPTIRLVSRAMSPAARNGTSTAGWNKSVKAATNAESPFAPRATTNKDRLGHHASSASMALSLSQVMSSLRSLFHTCEALAYSETRLQEAQSSVYFTRFVARHFVDGGNGGLTLCDDCFVATPREVSAMLCDAERDRFQDQLRALFVARAVKSANNVAGASPDNESWKGGSSVSTVYWSFDMIKRLLVDARIVPAMLSFLDLHRCIRSRLIFYAGVDAIAVHGVTLPMLNAILGAVARCLARRHMPPLLNAARFVASSVSAFLALE